MGVKVNSNSPLHDNVEVDFSQLVKDFISLLDNSPGI